MAWRLVVVAYAQTDGLLGADVLAPEYEPRDAGRAGDPDRKVEERVADRLPSDGVAEEVE